MGTTLPETLSINILHMGGSQKIVVKLKKFWERAIHVTKRLENWIFRGDQRKAPFHGLFFYFTVGYFEDLDKLFPICAVK